MLSREDLSKEALKLFKQNKNIILKWGTGLGKSCASIKIIEYLRLFRLKPKILLVVAERAHKSNWQKEFDKWGSDYSDITMECYASLKNYRDTNWDLIIFDEAHHLGSDLRLDIISSIKASHIILLSATLPRNLIDNLTDIFGKFGMSAVTLNQAIESNVLPKPRIFLIPLKLDNSNKDQEIIEEWGKKEKRIEIKCAYYDRWTYLKNKRLYPNVTLRISCTQKQKYDNLSDKFSYWKNFYLRTRQEYAKNLWLQAGSLRKKFLGECKTEYVKILLNQIKDKRYICFCSSIEQAELLGGANSIHSKKDNSLSIIEDFNSKKIDSLFAVGMLQEGQNLTNIEAGIIVQLDGQERAFIQKFGRSMRSEDPIQFIFYYKNTRDEEYLDSILDNIDEKFIYTINDINNFSI